MATKQPTDKYFNDALKLLAKNFGEGYNTKGLSEAVSAAIPTGHDDLDGVLTKGAQGIFQGGIIEIMGSEGSGKTSLALRTIGNAQKLGHKCCWIDCEASFTEDLAILNGCDPTELLIPELGDTKASDNGEGLSFFNSAQVLEMIYKTVVSNAFGLVVLDSVAGLMPQRVLEDNFDPNAAGIAELARNMATFLPKIAQACKKTQTSVIFINQLRDQPGNYFQDRFHTPGGKALKFFAHQRISVEKIKSKEGAVTSQDEEGKPETIGHYARVVIVKNRKAPPLPEGNTIEIPIYYKTYFPDDAKKVYDLARKLLVITMRQNVLTWKDENGTIILQRDGESGILSEIREKKLEAKLAAACIAASQSEKNTTRKVPIKITSSIVEMSKKDVPSTSKAKKSKVLVDAQDLS